jgi:protein-tyrosine phosphatase
MIDIHSHVLFGLDDGAETLEESLAMLEVAERDGTTDIVGSPHSNHEYTFDPDLISQRIADITEALNGSIRLHRGCDFHLSYDNIQKALDDPTPFTINHKNYLLVEFSDLLIPKSTDEVFSRMLAQRTIPIITHPERNPLLQTRLEMLRGWAEAGCLLQVTAQSILGRFGRTAKAACDALLGRNLVHIVASDAHDTQHRPPVLSEAYAAVARTYGEKRAELLFRLNPMATLVGDPIVWEHDPSETVPARRKWYQIW